MGLVNLTAGTEKKWRLRYRAGGESVMYFVAQLSSSRLVSHLQSDGFDACGAECRYDRTSAGCRGKSRKADRAPVTVRALTAEAGIPSAGAVNPQSSNPKLLSFDYLLSDRQADAPLVEAA